MTRQLLESIARQTHASIEVILSDDSTTDEVRQIANEYHSRGLTIRYFKNVPGLGYARNLGRTLELATGDLVIFLGDDDLFAHPSAVSWYVEAFSEHPEIAYAYSNQLQVSETLSVERFFRFFPHDRVFAPGYDAFRHTWSNAMFIPGIALRNDGRLCEWYPTQTLLFPQLVLVGHAIASHAAIGLSNVAIAGRAHEDQLGFYAIRGDRIAGEERHGVLEAIDILGDLIRQYRFNFTTDFLEERLVAAFTTTLLKERLVVGPHLASENYRRFVAVSKKARGSLRLRLSYILMRAMPRSAIATLRNVVIAVERFRHGSDLARYQREVIAMAGESA